MSETTLNQTERQGRITWWLKDHGSTIKALAAHCKVSHGTMSGHCNSATVPPHILEGMSSFRTPDGYSIPAELLPLGVARKPGPDKGWLQRRIEAATNGQV